MESPGSRATIGWAGSVLFITAVVAIFAKVIGVLIAPGMRGVAGESAVNFLETSSGAGAYTLTALLVALVSGASFELARTKSVNVVARGGVVAISGLIIALASPAVVERLGPHPSIALAIVTSAVALVGGALVSRVAETRAVGAVLALFSITALVRVLAWEASAAAFERGSQTVFDVARIFSTVAVTIQGVTALIVAAWIGTRGKWRGRILANLAIVLAFAITWYAARSSDTPSTLATILKSSLSAATAGSPPPFWLASVAAFLIPACILLAGAVLLQKGQSTAILVTMALALLSGGSFDVPLHALLATASVQWAILAMAAAAENTSSAPIVAPSAPHTSSS